MSPGRFRFGRRAALLALLLLTACATQQVSRPAAVEIAPGVTLRLPATPPFGPRGTAVQLVEARYGDRVATLQAVIESDAARTLVIMTVPSGPRIMTVDWSAAGFLTRLEPQAPAGLTGEHMLADMMLIYAPLDLLAAALRGGDVLEDAAGARRIMKDGILLIEITRPPDAPAANPWNGRAQLRNLAYDYGLAIDSQSAVP